MRSLQALGKNAWDFSIFRRKRLGTLAPRTEERSPKPIISDRTGQV
jgi:hypothetical protein